MMQKAYDKEFKVQAVKLGREIGFTKAAEELDVPKDTLYGWNQAAKDGRIDLGPGAQSPKTAMTLAEEVQRLRAENKAQAKEIKRLKDMRQT